MARKKHKNKHIEDAIKYAEDNGWTVEVHNDSKSHTWGVIKCVNNSSECWNRQHCLTSINSTPRSYENHAKQIKRIVDKCIFSEKNKKKEDEDE